MIERLSPAWPLAVRIPLSAALAVFLLAIAISHVALSWIFSQQQDYLRRLGAVYLDGISGSILPYVAADDAAGTNGALLRALAFHGGIRERRLIVLRPDGQVFAEASLPTIARPAVLTARLRQELLDEQGFVLDDDQDVAWVHRRLSDGGRVIAGIFAELDVHDLVRQRRQLRIVLVALTSLLSLACAGLGYVWVKRLLAPVGPLTRQLQEAEAGQMSTVPERELGPPGTELGRLLRRYNAMVIAVRDREALAARLAERDKTAVLGRLAAGLAHEVRNPLGGLFNAVDTLQKFGDDPAIRTRTLNLIERGLGTIRDVVGAALSTYRVPSEARCISARDLSDLRLLIEPEAKQRELGLEWSVDMPDELGVGATEVRQIALNLLLNACAASPSGGTVRFRAEFADDVLALTIGDQGPGFPPTVLAVIEGRQPDESVDGDGKGIGIWIVMRLLGELGGTIGVEPSGATGSRVTVRIPLKRTRGPNVTA